jgi:hypothetical protein
MPSSGSARGHGRATALGAKPLMALREDSICSHFLLGLLAQICSSRLLHSYRTSCRLRYTTVEQCACPVTVSMSSCLSAKRSRV